MLLNPRQVITWIVLFQIACQGFPLKKSFRHTKAKSEKKLEHLKANRKLKKEPLKNTLGKGKSSLDFDLDNFESDRNYGEGSRDLLSYYEAENGLEKMHVAPVHEQRSVSVQEPHLKYNYRFGVGEANHESHQSYPGEMIDDENTLSKFIAPPVFENHQNKLHQQESTRILYGTPEAQSAENANTKSLLNSLNSLMSPLSMSNFDEKLLGDLEPNSNPGKTDANEKSNIEYEGKYRVVNEEVERESEEYNHGNDDGEYSNEKDESKFTADRGEFDNRDREGYVRESIDRNDHFESDRGEENRHDPYNERIEDYHSRSRDNEKYEDHGQEDKNQLQFSETRSSQSRERSNYDGYDQQPYDNHRYDRNGKDEEDRDDHGGGKPIEVVQDNSGKLHPMSNSISREELNSEINKYMGHIPRN